MSIEDITNSKVCKFVFVISDEDMASSCTGVIKRFLGAKLQEEDNVQTIVLWAEVIPSCLSSRIECKIVHTGDEVPKGFQYTSTVHTGAGLVFHVYVKSYLIE